MVTCDHCLPGLICIPSWDCPRLSRSPTNNKNGRYYQENKERLKEAAKGRYDATKTGANLRR